MNRRGRKAAPLSVTSRGARCERDEGRSPEAVARGCADVVGLGAAARRRVCRRRARVARAVLKANLE